MSIRAVPRRVAVGTVAAAITGAMFVWSFASPVFATTFNSGVTVLQSASPNGTYSLGAPYSSGQAIGVQVPANSVLQPGVKVNILECSDPGGNAAGLPTSIADCDGNTIEGSTVPVQSDGSVSLSSYPVYALPDGNIGDTPTQTPVCNTSNPCVLYIGENQNDFTQPHVFSQPFTVAPNASDNGANPGDGGTSTVVAGVAFSATVTLTNSPPAGASVAKTKASPSLKGVTVTGNSNGTVTLSGTPELGKSGTYSESITEEFAAGHTKTTYTASVTINVLQPASFKATTPKTTATVGKPYKLKLKSNKGANPQPSITATGLPAGVTLTDNGNGSGEVSGDPTTAGTYPITVSEWNGVGPISSLSYTLTVSS